MNLEQLKAMLEKGEITQEEFDAKVQELNQQEEEGGDESGKEKENSFDKETLFKEFMESDLFKKALQSKEDQVRTKYVKEKKELEERLGQYEEQNLTAEEKLKKKERELKDYEARIKRQELDYETIKHLEEKDLPVSLLGHLKGETLEERQDSLENLNKIIEKHLEKKLEQTYKEQGRKVEKSSGQDGEIKSLKDLSLAERSELMEKNPQAYEKLLKQS